MPYYNSKAAQLHQLVADSIDSGSYAFSTLTTKELRAEAQLFREVGDWFFAHPERWVQGTDVQRYDDEIGNPLTIENIKMCAIGLIHQVSNEPASVIKPTKMLKKFSTRYGDYEDTMVNINDDAYVENVKDLRRAFYVAARILDEFALIPCKSRRKYQDQWDDDVAGVQMLRDITERITKPLIAKAEWSYKRNRNRAKARALATV